MVAFWEGTVSHLKPNQPIFFAEAGNASPAEEKAVIPSEVHIKRHCKGGKKWQRQKLLKAKGIILIS